VALTGLQRFSAKALAPCLQRLDDMRRLSRMTGFVRKFRKKISRWDGFEYHLRDVIAKVQSYWRRSEKSVPTVEHICRSVEGVHDAPSETNFKTKASKQGPTSIGGRRIVIVPRKRSVRSP
jgi:hypothetical protein